MESGDGGFLDGPAGRRFQLVVECEDTGARFRVYENPATGDLLVRIRPNQGAITTASAGDALVRELRRLRPPSEGRYTLLFWPETRLHPTPEVRRAWAGYLKQANVARVCLLNYERLGAPYKVVAQLLIGAAGMRNARFFRTLEEALAWAHAGERAGEPVYPYGDDEGRAAG